MKKTRRGRPKGKKNVLVKAGLSPDENLRLAVAGDLNGKDGTFWAHDLWLHANPRPAVRDQGVQAGLDPEYAAEIRDDINRETGNAFGEEAFRRVKAGDGEFFRDFGETIERLASERWPDDNYRASLLAFLEYGRETRGPVSIPELREHLKKDGINKSVRALQTALGFFGYDYVRGKGGRRPAPRTHKRRRAISMRALVRSADEGFERFIGSRPEMQRRKNPGHFR